MQNTTKIKHLLTAATLVYYTITTGTQYEKLEIKAQKLLTSNDLSTHFSFTPQELLSLRLICKNIADDLLPIIYEEYYEKDSKHISSVCAFLDCVYKNKLEKVHYLHLRNPFFIDGLYFLTNCYQQSYASLSPMIIALHNQNKYQNIDVENQPNKVKQNITDNNIIINLLEKNNKIKNYSKLDIDLCMTACVCDIDKFEQLKKNEDNKNTIALVIWAAAKIRGWHS